MSILELRPDQIAGAPGIVFEELEDRDGRITLFEPVQRDHDYAAGGDFALGMEGKDRDTAIVLDVTTDPHRQVATMEGRWGERADRPLYALLRYYNTAFFLGERQGGGLAILRSLLEDYEYGYLWYERDLVTRGAKMRDKLGYAKKGKRAHDPLLRGLRLDVRTRSTMWRDPALLDEMGRLQFVATEAKIKNSPEEITDSDVDIKLVGGGSPDLVIAAMYAIRAARDMWLFEKPKPRYDEGTLGAVLGHEELEQQAPFYRPRNATIERPKRGPRRRVRRGR